MKVPFHLRPAASPGAIAGLLLLSDDVVELVRLCARLGGDTLPPIYEVPGGFLVRLSVSLAEPQRNVRGSPTVGHEADPEETQNHHPPCGWLGNAGYGRSG